jgi:hypothetical protein
MLLITKHFWILFDKKKIIKKIIFRYIPYEKSYYEYEAVERIEYVPREKKVVDHYAIEYQTEYVPQAFQDRYVEYIPQERVVERVEYKAVERQVVHQPQQETVV